MEGRCGRKKSQLGEMEGGRGGMKKEGIKGKQMRSCLKRDVNNGG